MTSSPETSTSATELTPKLKELETLADGIAENLGVIERSTAPPEERLTTQEISQIRESLKRITSRLSVSIVLTERVPVRPERVPESPAEEGERRQMKPTPEDEMFPLQGVSDPATGLPTRIIAEKAFDAALQHGRPRYAAIFVLDRIRHMANRYSGDVGNQAMRHYANFLRQKLPSDALIFRWRGASFVTLFDISGSPSDAKLLMEQIATQKQKFSFMTNNRSAMVNLTASFLTIPIGDHQTLDTIGEAGDVFIESHSGRQPS